MNQVLENTDPKSGRWGLKDEVPYILAYWGTFFARKNRTNIPEDVLAIIDNTPKFQEYIRSRDSLRGERDRVFKNNPHTSHA